MTTLLVDSACDLPRRLIDKFNIRLLPATIVYGDNTLQDHRNPSEAIKLYNSDAFDKGHNSETAPTSIQDITRIIEEVIASGENDLIIQTVNRIRSPTYEHAVEAASTVLKKYSKNPPNIRVQDSRTVFTGQGVLAAHTIALMNKGVNGSKLRRTIDLLSSKVHAYQVPKDVYYLRTRGRKKGDNSISLLGAIVGRALGVCPIVLALDDQTFPVDKVRGFENATETLFQHTIKKVNAGLLSPFVCISIAGDPRELLDMPGYQELKAAIKARKYQLIITPMSLSGGVNLGRGTLSLAFACEPYEWSS